MKFSSLSRMRSAIQNKSLRRVAAVSMALLCGQWAMAQPITSNRGKASQKSDECIGFVDRNLAKGPENFYIYLTISRARLTIKPGDVLEYEVFLDPRDPSPKGGVDIRFSNADAFRDDHIPDQNGIDSHGDGLLKPAIDHWYLRKIPLTSLAGDQANQWTLVFEGDEFGQYAQFIDHLRVVHSDGSSTSIYPNKHPLMDEVDSVHGYSGDPYLAELPRSEVQDEGPVNQAVDQVIRIGQRRAKLASVLSALNLAKSIPDISASSRKSIEQSIQKLDELEANTSLSDAQFQTQLDATVASAASAKEVLRSLTADLIGHAHIDVQWLWESPESLQAAHNTWNQAVKFMEEYPGFTFTQSSAGYYREVQHTWPKLFAAIQAEVKKGQWEIVGGRECEADENLISPEDSAMQFLYAQRYFRQEFGKTAEVGWEPDTFGHTAQMPQILALGGCKYYYFCRGGQGKPLFNWEALDGTKVLAYDEVAAGAWYDTALNASNFNEFAPYIKKTGRKEMMWVYGVGNHGGGPTKEYIDQAVTWQKAPLAPTVKFATAGQFFHRMEKQDPSSIPTIKSELEGVFMGCYTTNSFEKKRNDYAEADTVQAEATAAVAHALGGFPYPTKRFAHNWEKIMFNQHHDTLCGSSFHWAYQQTITDLDAAIADAKDISRDAMENLCVQVTPSKGGANFLVFNSLGWSRSGWATVYLPTSFGGPNPVFNNPVAEAPNGTEFPITVVDPNTREAKFYANDIPAFGYKVFVIKDSPNPVSDQPQEVVQSGDSLSNGKLNVEFDNETGNIKSLQVQGIEFAGKGGLGGLVNTPENPGPDAWTLHPNGTSFDLRPIAHKLVSGFKGKGMQYEYEIAPSQPDLPPTRIWQTFWLKPGSDHVDVDFKADWQVISNLRDPSPFLRADFHSDFNQPTARYQVPFGVVERPTDGSEGPIQSWADVSGSHGHGLAIVVDCKHGFSCQDSRLRMSLIRGCYAPDPLPNPGLQTAEYQIVPHVDEWNQAYLANRGAEIRTDLLSIPVPPDAEGTAPLSYSFAHFTDAQVLTTGLKLSEDGQGYIFRFIDGPGKASQGTLNFDQSVSSANWVNFIEDNLHGADVSGNKVSASLTPWQIGNLFVQLKGSK